ncbi:hypothetical protein E2C01_034260 [Portunus trituberculatus]|uniref:Uncharacterized protein n=1 Tax=Portunus trituberculatus TaxID=210409 RepID=A0A5B7F540_PORTR|nr:hypothetical protein [Portunus trituberculatus]
MEWICTAPYISIRPSTGASAYLLEHISGRGEGVRSGAVHHSTTPRYITSAPPTQAPRRQPLSATAATTITTSNNNNNTSSPHTQQWCVTPPVCCLYQGSTLGVRPRGACTARQKARHPGNKM